LASPLRTYYFLTYKNKKDRAAAVLRAATTVSLGKLLLTETLFELRDASTSIKDALLTCVERVAD
jgi:hypothetical protein